MARRLGYAQTVEEWRTPSAPLRRRVRSVTLASIGAAALLGAGCGGDGGETEKPKVDKQALEASVNKIDEECIKSGFDPKAVDPGISVEVDRLVEAFEADPKASLSGTDLKAHTVEEAVGDVAETLEECRPEDALRVNEALAKP